MTIKQYIYPPSVVGLDDWGPGTLRLTDIPVTDNPDEADVFVCPHSLRNLRDRGYDVQTMPLLKGREERHVFFDVSDDEQLYGLPCIFLRFNVRPWYFDQDPNSVSLSWPVQGQEFFDCIEPPPEGFKYDISFQGWVKSHQTREEATASCLNTDGLTCDFAMYNDFFGYLKPEDPEYERRKREHHRSLKESRLALCPESINGVFPYRFFEAMAAGRVPILVGRDFVFPMRDRIPWDSFCVMCARESAMNVGLLAKEILKRTTDDDLLIMGAAAQYYWKTELDSRDWPAMMARVVQEEFEKRCISR